MGSTDRDKLDIVTLNEVSHDLSELSGFLLGKDQQGGMLRDMQTSVAEMRKENHAQFIEMKTEITGLRLEHHQELADIKVQIGEVETDVDHEHTKIRDLEKWRDKQQRSWSTFLTAAFKVVLTVGGGVLVLYIAQMVLRFGGVE